MIFRILSGPLQIIWMHSYYITVDEIIVCVCMWFRSDQTFLKNISVNADANFNNMNAAFVNPISSSNFGKVKTFSSFTPSTSAIYTHKTTWQPSQPSQCRRTPIPNAYGRLRMSSAETGEAEGEKKKRPLPPREVSPEVKELRSMLKKCSIYLIGPMGSGKSVVGNYLSRELDFRFLDTDDLIESLAKRSASEIFETEGEKGFREIESAILDQVVSFIGCCVATGGGIVTKKENWGYLQTGLVIYLNTPVDVLKDRLLNETDKRPLLKDAESLRDRIEDILEERKHLYEQADVTIQVAAGMAVDEVGKEIIRSLTNFIKSNPPKLAALYPGNVRPPK